MNIVCKFDVPGVVKLTKMDNQEYTRIGPVQWAEIIVEPKAA